MEKPPAKMNRRRFLKLLAGAPVFAILGSAGIAAAETQRYGNVGLQALEQSESGEG
jgi:hypothetical protein